ncbi:MAG: hypothetical protein IH889_11340, partial [Planctomycetes bacterium]|nr:hypothetical protein [Planctomycetota bacterium]
MARRKVNRSPQSDHFRLDDLTATFLDVFFARDELIRATFLLAAVDRAGFLVFDDFLEAVAGFVATAARAGFLVFDGLLEAVAGFVATAARAGFFLVDRFFVAGALAGGVLASFGSLIVDDFLIVRAVLGGVLATFSLVVGVEPIIGRVFGVAVGARVGFFGSGRCQGTVTTPS